jgi:hypothetical protein
LSAPEFVSGNFNDAEAVRLFPHICHGYSPFILQLSSLQVQRPLHYVSRYAPQVGSDAWPAGIYIRVGHFLAANTAEATKQQGIEIAQKLAAQLRTAEDRIRELETKVRYYEDGNDRVERWLYQISTEIEQRFLDSPTVVLRSNRQSPEIKCDRSYEPPAS